MVDVDGHTGRTATSCGMPARDRPLAKIKKGAKMGDWAERGWFSELFLPFTIKISRQHQTSLQDHGVLTSLRK
jgi:hypothetical protein